MSKNLQVHKDGQPFALVKTEVVKMPLESAIAPASWPELFLIHVKEPAGAQTETAVTF
jgi:hypothetical protein